MEQTEQQASGVNSWDYRRSLKTVDQQVARYSKGFLRTQAKKWFPGFSAQWLPLAHSLGVEFKIGNVKPVFKPSLPSTSGFYGEINGEPIALLADADDIATLLEPVVPNTDFYAKDIVAEYLSRRMFKSLTLAWSGPELASTSFVGATTTDALELFAGLEFDLFVNNTKCKFWIAFGESTVTQLDGLWRRQLRSISSQKRCPENLHIEIAQIAVKPIELSQYTTPGTLVDLETEVTDVVTLRSGSDIALPARLCIVEDCFAAETIASSVPELSLPEGMTRLSIELGVLGIKDQAYSEHLQPGAVWETDLPLSDKVKLLVNNEVIGEAILCTFEGKFAISVS